MFPSFRQRNRADASLTARRVTLPRRYGGAQLSANASHPTTSSAPSDPLRNTAQGTTTGNAFHDDPTPDPCPNTSWPSILISGGQTGVDQAALRAAIDVGLSIGGWCPPGRESERGPIPSIFPLKETPRERSELAPHVPRSQRTEWNVRDSDATLVIRPNRSDLDYDPGTDWTVEAALHYRRPLITCDPATCSSEAAIVGWIRTHKIRTLNVGGPSEATAPRNWRSGLQTPERSIQMSTSDAQAPPWWVKIVRDNWLKALVVVLIVIVVIQTTLLLGNIRVIGGELYYGSVEQGAHVTVDAIAGFQDSGIPLEQGDTIRLRPEGRVHIALGHATNLANNTKNVIVNSELTSFPNSIMNLYPKPIYSDENIFYRHWVGPAGESRSSDILEEIKLKTDSPWGALLATVMDRPISSHSDPFELLQANELSPQDLVAVAATLDFEAPRDGFLVFIINEAVLSPHSTSPKSKDYYEILTSEAQKLHDKPRHEIAVAGIPLIWYADNGGAFRILVER